MKPINLIDPDTLIDFHAISQTERLKIGLISSWRQLKQSWSIFSRNRLAVLGLVFLLVYILMAIIHPILLKTVWQKSIYDPIVGFDMDVLINPSPPSTRHPLGTDTLGRDVLSMLMAATKPSLTMALTSALSAAIIGTLISAFSAYFRGIVDGFFSHISDLTLFFPAPLVMVIIGFMLDIGPLKFGLIYGIMVGLGVVSIVLRSHALTVVNRTFIDAARVAGGSAFHIIFRHLVPHLIPLAAVNMLLTVTGAIFANGFIAFLGLSRAHLNWGSMIYDSFTYQGINGVIPWNVLVPSAMAISLFAASFYMIALGLQDVTNPRLTERFLTESKLLARKKEMKVKVEKVTLEPVGPKPALPPVPSYDPSVRHTVEVRSVESVEQTVELLAKPEYPHYPHWITVLVFSLNGAGNSIDSNASTLLTQMSKVLVNRGGLVKQLSQGLYVAAFGLEKDLQPRASAWFASTSCLQVTRALRKYKQQRTISNPDAIKLSVGISIGQVEFFLGEKSMWYAPVLAAEVGLVARTLCTFAGFMREGGVLICENTYNYLKTAQHHFAFGRQGLAKLPPANEQKMVYELDIS